MEHIDQSLIDAGQQNFSLPHDVVVLPSGGVFYKSKKKSVKVGYLTASDENYLLNTNRNGKDNVIIGLLRNKVYEPDLRPDELLEGDVEAILLFLRNTSFGPEYNLSLLDPTTGKYFKHVEYLDSLNIKQTEFKPESDGTFTTKLPKTGVTVKLRPLTYSELAELDRMAEEYPTGLTVPKITWRLNKMVVSVDGLEDRGHIAQFIETLPIMDSKYIRNFIKDNQPSLDLKRNVIAPSGEKVTFEVSFGAEFFRPFF
jgi:hypothetical protein